jgi:hypothetical protein
MRRRVALAPEIRFRASLGAAAVLGRWAAEKEGTMLREEDVRIDQGRASHGGDFLCLTHVPTGVSRLHPGPLRGINQYRLKQSWLSEIEAELPAKGLTQHIVPAYRTKQTGCG